MPGGNGEKYINVLCRKNKVLGWVYESVGPRIIIFTRMEASKNVWNIGQAEVGIDERKILRKKTRFRQRKQDLAKKKERKQDLEQEKKRKTRSWPRKKERNQDLDQEEKQVLISYFFSFIISHLRRYQEGKLAYIR